MATRGANSGLGTTNSNRIKEATSPNDSQGIGNSPNDTSNFINSALSDNKTNF